MQGYQELVEKLRKIKSMGYIRTHRAGDGGIGKTLEDLLGIKENNVPGPDGEMIELKSGRKGGTSMLTLFTKSPEPDGANSVILRKFGYPSKRGNNRVDLHTTVNAVSYNTLKGKEGFKIEVYDDRIEFVTPSLKEGIGFWKKETLRKTIERKLPRVIYVNAECEGKGKNEEFWYKEAWVLSDFNFENFYKLLKDGVILVDIRIGQYPNGNPHDHGTAFRVVPDKLDLCFTHRESVV